MVRLTRWQWSFFVAAVLACGPVTAAETPGQAMLDKATETKLSAERVSDLNEVINLCQEAIKVGLDEANQKFANELLASTLTQRASLICLELFEQPVTPGRARKLVPMALSDLEETLKIDTEQAEAQYLLGRLYAHLGEREKAIKSLDAAVRLTENDSPARSKSLMIRANLHEDADKQQADYDEAVKLMPRDPNTLRFRGMHHFGQRRYDQALADFNAALEIDPEDSDTLEAQGLALSMLERYDEAMTSFNKAIEIQPEAAMAYVHRARIRAVKGDNRAALSDAEVAVKLQPTSVQARLLRAALLGAVGKFDKALDELNLLRGAMPDSPEILLQIAMLHQAAKQPREALTAYDMLLRADPGNAAGYRGRADVHLSMGNQVAAITDYEKALEVEPKNSGVLNNLAWVLATSPDDDLRDGTRAIELATLACEVTEFKQAHILSTLAAGYAEKGDFDTAIKWSKKAVEESPPKLKGQLGKELISYEARKPWREVTPAPDDDDDSPADASNKPDDDDTARANKTDSE